MQLIDIVPRRGPGDDILLSADRNPNTNGARLLGVTSEPGAQLAADRARRSPAARSRRSSRSARIRSKPESPPEQLSSLPAFICMDLLENSATSSAHGVASFRRFRGKTRLDDQRQRPTAAFEPRHSSAGPGARRLGNPARSDSGVLRAERHLHDRRSLRANEPVGAGVRGAEPEQDRRSRHAGHGNRREPDAGRIRASRRQQTRIGESRDASSSHGLVSHPHLAREDDRRHFPHHPADGVLHRLRGAPRQRADPGSPRPEPRRARPGFSSPSPTR